jgi:CBS domain-containing protein
MVFIVYSLRTTSASLACAPPQEAESGSAWIVVRLFRTPTAARLRRRTVRPIRADPDRGIRVATDGEGMDAREDSAMTSPTAPHQLDRSSAGPRVQDAMTTGLISCTPETPLRSIAAIMAERRVHAVYVFDYGFEDDETVELWGLVSDLDLVAAARGDIDRRTARDSSVTPLVHVFADDSLDRAAQLMVDYSTSHLAVLDRETRRPVGVLSTLDVARIVAA